MTLRGEIEEALLAFSKAIELNPDNSITWYNKGLTLIRSNKLAPAVECFDKAIKNNDSYAKAWYNKGRALSMLGKTEESQQCFNTARKLDPLLFTKVRKMK
jgi:tetratricopeptide (TPR) repeat protein